MEESPSRHKATFLEKLSHLLLRAPEDRQQLLDLLHSAFERNLLDADALFMIKGTLQVSEMTVQDVMIPRSQMDVIYSHQSPEEIVQLALQTKHSRFPVVGEDKDDVVGILLAKDLLRYFTDPQQFQLAEILRPPWFVPETKRLNVLLREFRINRNHLALVVDEYGGVSGLVTIEDVLEQIVGEIEDEYDTDEAVPGIILDGDGRYRVQASTKIADFNAAFNTDFTDEDCDTIGGLILSALGHLPKQGEIIELAEIKFEVAGVDDRKLDWLLIERIRNLAQPLPE